MLACVHARACSRFARMNFAIKAARTSRRGAHLFSHPAPLPTYSPRPFSTLPLSHPLLSSPPGTNPLSTLVEFPFRIVPRHFSRQLRSLVREIPRRSISFSLSFFLSSFSSFSSSFFFSSFRLSRILPPFSFPSFAVEK